MRLPGVIEGKRYFESPRQNNTHAVTEDQLMEEFAFGVAKKTPGRQDLSGQETALMFETPSKNLLPCRRRPPVKKKRLPHQAVWVFLVM